MAEYTQIWELNPYGQLVLTPKDPPASLSWKTLTMITSIVVNYTLAISLSSTWPIKDVEVEVLPKGEFPSMMREALWYDEQNAKIYAWGGRSRENIGPESNHRQLWGLKTSESTQGEWAIQRPSNPIFFDNMLHLVEGASTTCNQVGYYYNGFSSTQSDSRIYNSSIVSPGLLPYDFNTMTWANESTDALGYVAYGGSATCLPDLGKKGMLLFMGGVKGQQGYYDAWDLLHFSNVTLYDPETGEWYWQETSGDIPYSRETFCAVGVAGPNNTFEM